MADSTTTTGNYMYVYPDCPYRSICSDNGAKCETCANNPKRSYYRPVEPYIPYVPYIPYYPNWPYYWQPVFYTTTNNSDTQTFYTTT